MRFFHNLVGSLMVTAVFASAASVTGNVKGPDGKPMMGVFVVAENTQNKMTVTVNNVIATKYATRPTRCQK